MMTVTNFFKKMTGWLGLQEGGGMTILSLSLVGSTAQHSTAPLVGLAIIPAASAAVAATVAVCFDISSYNRPLGFGRRKKRRYPRVGRPFEKRKGGGGGGDLPSLIFLGAVCPLLVFEEEQRGTHRCAKITAVYGGSSNSFCDRKVKDEPTLAVSMTQKSSQYF